MEIDAFHAMSESFYRNVMRTIEDIMLIIAMFAVAGFVIYIIGVVWFCFSERRQPAHQQMKPVPEPPEPDEYDLLTILAVIDEDLSRREPALTSPA